MMKSLRASALVAGAMFAATLFASAQTAPGVNRRRLPIGLALET